MIGESAGAIICIKHQYIEQMDESRRTTHKKMQGGCLISMFFPHYLTAPFKESYRKIMTEFSDLNLCPINNRQGFMSDAFEVQGYFAKTNLKIPVIRQYNF